MQLIETLNFIPSQRKGYIRSLKIHILLQLIFFSFINFFYKFRTSIIRVNKGSLKIITIIAVSIFLAIDVK